MVIPWLLAALLGASTPGEKEALVSLDLREADVVPVARALAEAAAVQLVADPGVSCRLTLSVTAAPWRSIMGSVLKACALGAEEKGRILRIAPLARLTREAQDRRKLLSQAPAGPDTLLLHRLSYARAQELAPLLERWLPGGRVTYDVRTNTLLITSGGQGVPGAKP